MLDKWLNKLERRFGRFAIPDLMLYVSLTMGLVLIFDIFVSRNPNSSLSLISLLSFDRGMILRGQVWRIITFLLIPNTGWLLLAFLALYFYWMMGTGLERQWGTFRFNVYFFAGAIGCIIAGFITGYATNVYHYMSIFLAFAMVYPDYEVLLFFIIPVKVKWLGIADGILLLILFIFGSWLTKLFIVLSLINLIIFFGPKFWDKIYYTCRRYYYKWFKKM